MTENPAFPNPAAITPGLTEAWMRGPIPGVDPLVAPILYCFQQAREDLARWTNGLTTDQLWAQPHGFGSVGFHLRHVAGSTDRLMTYLRGEQLTEAEMAFMKAEHSPGASREELLDAMDQVFRQAEVTIRALDPARLADARGVG